MTQFDSVPLPPRLPLVVMPSNRTASTSKDARLVNCYIEVDEQDELWICKRPGITEATSTTASTGRGLFNWQGDTYAIFNGTLYRNGSSVISGLDQTNGLYQFTSILGATPKLVLGNGNKTYAYTVAGGLTADLNSIDSDFPAINVKGFAYLNGPLYVMQAGESKIWGSAVNSVSVAGDWDPLNVIAAQAEPDESVYIARQGVYILGMNQWSIEVFFDAGNETGSPLGNVQGSKLDYGCAHADSVQRIDGKLFFLSATRSGSVQVAMIENLELTIISTESLDRIIENDDLSTVFSLQVKMDGHNFYVLTLKESNITMVYDISEGLWHQWTDTSGNYFPFVASTYDSSRRTILQHETNGKTYFIDADYTNDAGSKITVDIYTPNFDAQTRRRKNLNYMEFIADQVPGSVLLVRKNDNDYDPKKWSNYRKVDLGKQKPFLTNCGTFVKRAYHLRHQSNTRFRIQAAEVQYDLGTL